MEKAGNRQGAVTIKVFHLIYSLETGGAETDLLAKSRILARQQNCDVTVGCLLKRGDLAPRAEEAGVRVVGPLMRSKGDVRVIPRLVRLLRAGRYDVVHTHMFASNLLGRLAAMIAGVQPIVATVQLIADRESWWQILLDRLLQHCTASMVASSEAVRQSFIRRGIRPAKIRTIYNSIDLTHFDVDREAVRRATRREFGWDESHFVVGAVARLEKVKGLEHLVEAAQAVVQAIPGARFLFVGDGPERACLQAQARRLGLERHCLFAGLRQDVPQILPALDLFALPSLSEALGIAAIEALASGVPVVASRVGGVPEVVVSGETGLLIPHGNAHQLAEAILRVAARPEEARLWAEQGRNRVRRMFDVQRLAAAQIRLYHDCLTQRKSS